LDTKWWSGSLEGRAHLGDITIYRRIILKFKICLKAIGFEIVDWF
jgi:hypothetical protein